MSLAPSRGATLPPATAPRSVVVARLIAAFLLAFASLALCAAAARAQQPPPASARATNARGAAVVLSLDEALKIAQAQSQTVEIARSGVVRATGQKSQAHSQYLPQLSASAGYSKLLASQFSSLASAAASQPVNPTPALCAPFVGPNATPDQRAAALAQAATCQSSSGGGFNLSNTSFGATNDWTAGLNFSQNVYTGGRVQAQNAAADAQLRSANIEVGAQRAQVSLDVTSAYYDALLADQLVAIADSTVAQTAAVLSQTRVAKQVGNTSQYELLRAQVTYQNQLPVAIQARSNRQVAYLRVKQLLNLPLDDSLQLTSAIEGTSGPVLPAIAANAAADTSVYDRAPVREADQAVDAQEAQVRIARAERIPQFSIVSSYQRLYFPVGVVPSVLQGVNNWTVGVQASMPIFDGGRIKGDELIAQAGAQQARAQREQTRQLAALDTRVALNDLQQSQATWQASQGTVEEAQQAYSIDEIRFQEGISTQTDLTQSRLLLEQARANRAQAARDLAVARVRLALLHDLPLQANSAQPSSAQNSQTQQQQAQQQQAQQQTQTPTQTQQTQTGTGGSPVSGAPPGAGASTGSIQP